MTMGWVCCLHLYVFVFLLVGLCMGARTSYMLTKTLIYEPQLHPLPYFPSRVSPLENVAMGRADSSTFLLGVLKSRNFFIEGRKFAPQNPYSLEVEYQVYLWE